MVKTIIPLDSHNIRQCGDTFKVGEMTYVVENEVGRLVLDSASYTKLDDGVYGLKKINQYLVDYAIVASKNNCKDLVSFYDYTLEIHHGDVILFFHPANLLEQLDFFDHRDDYQWILDWFENCVGCHKPFFVYNRGDKIIGISNMSGSGLVREFLDFSWQSIPAAGTGAISMERMEENYINHHFDRYLRTALNRLSPKAMLDYCEERIQGQGISLKIAVYQICQYMQSVAAGGDFHARNFILTAPSGSGKTEFYRAIHDLFKLYDIPIPVVQIDLSLITEAGYKGANVSTIPQRILSCNPKLKGIAICFLDEMDKKCIPSYGSHGINNNAAVQSNLLTLIEGSELKVEVDDVETDFNSNHTMFILMGAFQDIRQQKSKKLRQEKPLGFSVERNEIPRKSNMDRAADLFFEDLTLQDIIDFGMTEELAGRMVQVVNFHKLSNTAMRKLIKCKVKEISKELNIEIELTKASMKDFLDISFGSLGVRRPMNMIRELVQNTVAEAFFEEKFDSRRDKVVISSPHCARIKRNCLTPECEH